MSVLNCFGIEYDKNGRKRVNMGKQEHGMQINNTLALSKNEM